MKKYEIPSKEDMFRYYITEKHNKKECAEYFKTTVSTFTIWLSRYGITKLNSTNSNKKNPEISQEELKEYFVAQCHTIDECVEHFKISKFKLKSLLFQYNIKKTPQEVAQTIGRTTAEKYGVAYYRSEESKLKTKETCLKKFGVDNPSKSSEIKKKISDKESYVIPPKDELYQHYIVENLSRKKLAEFYSVGEGVCTKWLKHYSITKDEKLKAEARKKTNLEKYGVEYYVQAPEFIQNNINNNLAKYGVENYAQKDILHLDIWKDKEKMAKFLLDHSPKMTSVEISNYFNVNISAALRKIHEFQLEDLTEYNAGRSHYENEIVEFLIMECGISLNEIVLNDRSVLKGEEIDIYIPSKKFGIEFNGEYWHCELQKKYSDHNGRSIIHQNKSLSAEEKGIFLFHIFEHEWDQQFINKNPKLLNSKKNIKNRIKSILVKNTNRVPGRKTKIKELTFAQKKEFLDANHMQGNDITSSVYLGLFYKETLVACMTFSKSKFTKYQWELSRFCNLNNTNVIGGASKLFKHFLDKYVKNGERIVSYNDITKTQGDLYKILGFTCVSVNDPNYWWVNLDNYDIRSRYQEQQAGEVERMHKLGYVRIADCGTKTWTYIK